MFMSKSVLTASQLLGLIEGASYETTTTSPMGFETSTNVVDYDILTERLSELVNNEPANLFADLIGLNCEEADAYINTRCNGDGKKNKAGTVLPLVSSTTVFFEDGRETDALWMRTQALRGTSGMITGKGLGIEYDLIVSITDGKISEIIHYGE